ncbi:hypothetical protein Q1695_005453 [Nippostrongylus brasiliensis]|nr:hypothetical protein Q1695_005453 [Nippostrongylus brasiliensis]
MAFPENDSYLRPRRRGADWLGYDDDESSVGGDSSGGWLNEWPAARRCRPRDTVPDEEMPVTRLSTLDMPLRGIASCPTESRHDL